MVNNGTKRQARIKGPRPTETMKFTTTQSGGARGAFARSVAIIGAFSAIHDHALCPCQQ